MRMRSVGCLVVEGGVAWSKLADPAAFACADGGGPLPGGGSLRGRDPSMRAEAVKCPK